MEQPKLEKPVQALSGFNRHRLIQLFFFGVFIFLLYQLLRILSPFFIAILGSSILALIFHPLHALVLRRLKTYPSIAAGATTSLIVLIVVIPMLLSGWLLIKETPKVYPAAKGWIENLRQFNSDPSSIPMPDKLRVVWDKTSRLMDLWNIEPQDVFLKNLDQFGENMSHFAATIIRETVFVIFNLLLLALTLFFFLRDGPSIINRLVELIPMPHAHKIVILQRIQDTLHAVIRGVLVIAVLQGFLTGLGLAIFGVPFPVLLGGLAMLLSPIPVIGAAGVWLPVAVCLALSGSVRTAIYITLWCVGLVHTIDNVARPLLIGTHAKLPFLLLFFGLLGGLRIYGFMGLLLGPLVVALVLAFVSIYQQEYQWLLKPSQEKKDE